MEVKTKMSSLKLAGIIGTGGIGVLSTGLIASNLLNLSIQWIFAGALLIFVAAGAVALMARSGILP